MNPWDFVTWLAAFLLAGSAVLIFGFFLRDARSILNREMHPGEEPKGSSASGSAAEGARPAAPEDLPR